MARVAILVGVALIVVLAVVLWPSNEEPELTGPSFGEGEPVYLFQAYDCLACHEFTLNGTLAALIAELNGTELVIVNVERFGGFGAAASTCVHQVAPERWLDWNQFAFEEQPYGGRGWPSQDGLLFQTERHLALNHTATDAFENCFVRETPSAHVATEFWEAGGAKLPALYDGKWHPATVASLQAIQTASL